MKTKTITSINFLPDRTLQVVKKDTARSVILNSLDTPQSAKQFAKKHKINQSLVSQTMYNLYQNGLLRRIVCDCGKGFIYQKKQ